MILDYGWYEQSLLRKEVWDRPCHQRHFIEDIRYCSLRGLILCNDTCADKIGEGERSLDLGRVDVHSPCAPNSG